MIEKLISTTGSTVKKLIYTFSVQITVVNVIKSVSLGFLIQIKQNDNKLLECRNLQRTEKNLISKSRHRKSNIFWHWDSFPLVDLIINLHYFSLIFLLLSRMPRNRIDGNFLSPHVSCCHQSTTMHLRSDGSQKTCSYFQFFYQFFYDVYEFHNFYELISKRYLVKVPRIIWIKHCFILILLIKVFYINIATFVYIMEKNIKLNIGDEFRNSTSTKI